ncbi:MAG: nitroreductase family protein [Clostridia bacterium]|nr:nitroreductase family protein [Clostridia bacterium]
MDVEKAIMTRRTIRKYKQQPISRDILVRLIEGARLAPSASNLQPLVYLVIDDPDQLESVFGLLGWAGYLAPSGTPREGEKPVAYIIVLANTHIRMSGFEHDAGAAIENILLMAWSMGIGSCWIGSVDKKALADLYQIPDHYVIDSVVALGYAAETSIAEDAEDSIRYYKDENQVLHVPKRKLKDICFFNEI